MMDCLKTLNEILIRYQNRITAYRFSLNMEYSLQDLLDAQRKYFSIKGTFPDMYRQPERDINISLGILTHEDEP